MNRAGMPPLARTGLSGPISWIGPLFSGIAVSSIPDESSDEDGASQAPDCGLGRCAEDVNMDQRFVSQAFPRSSGYHSEWIMASVSGGANSLWLTEWLTEALELRPGMRVLDLGCGRGASSIFLRREFRVQVWAVDLWNSASERL